MAALPDLRVPRSRPGRGGPKLVLSGPKFVQKTFGARMARGLESMQRIDRPSPVLGFDFDVTSSCWIASHPRSHLSRENSLTTGQRRLRCLFELFWHRTSTLLLLRWLLTATAPSDISLQQHLPHHLFCAFSFGTSHTLIFASACTTEALTAASDMLMIPFSSSRLASCVAMTDDEHCSCTCCCCYYCRAYSCTDRGSRCL